MDIISEFYSDDEIRKTQIVKNPNVGLEKYTVKVWIEGCEQAQHEKSFNTIEVAEWYAEEWVQK